MQSAFSKNYYLIFLQFAENNNFLEIDLISVVFFHFDILCVLLQFLLLLFLLMEALIEEHCNLNLEESAQLHWILKFLLNANALS